MDLKTRVPKISLGIIKSEWIGKTLCNKCSQNTSQCFFCPNPPAYFTQIFKRCISRREGEEPPAWCMWDVKQQLSRDQCCASLECVACHRGGTGCAALGQFPWSAVSSSNPAHTAVLTASALSHPVVNPGSIWQHGGTRPLYQMYPWQSTRRMKQGKAVCLYRKWLGQVSYSVHWGMECCGVKVGEILTLSSLVLSYLLQACSKLNSS